MIVTHTQNAEGKRRVYLGGKGSLECWIDPKTDSNGWTFHVTEAVTGNQLTPDDQRLWARHTLLKLAEELDVSPPDLYAVPFEAIAALHTTDPFAGRRVATPRRKTMDQAFMATAPHVTRPRGDFRQPPGEQASKRR